MFFLLVFSACGCAMNVCEVNIVYSLSGVGKECSTGVFYAFLTPVWLNKVNTPPLQSVKSRQILVCNRKKM